MNKPSAISPLKLSPKNQPVGLFIYCNGCKSNPKKGTCPKGGKCAYPDRQVYKVRLHVPGTVNARKTVVLQTREESVAVSEAIQLKNGFKVNIQEEINSPQLPVFSYILKFLEFKKSPTKNRKPISDDTVNDYSLHLKLMATCMIENGLNPKSTVPALLNDKFAEMIFSFVCAKFESSVTHRKYFVTYRHFINFLIKEEKILMTNPFNGWSFDPKESENEIIYEKEFLKLLQAIDTEAPYHEVPGEKARKMNHPWTKDGIRLGLFTGARRQEIPLIKWTDIIPNKYTGELAGGVLILRDLKNERIKKKKKTKPVEINMDLADLLMEMGYESKRGSDLYLLDPSGKMDRDFIKNTLSRSFAYYIGFATNRALSFKCLRKTWFTNCSIAVGDENASKMGGHSEKTVTLEAYINHLEKTGSSMKFSRIFMPPVHASGAAKEQKVAKFD